MSQLDEAEGSNVANPLKPLFKKKRSGKGKSSNTLRSFLGDTNDKEASSIEAGGEGGEQGEEERLSLEDLIALRAMRAKPSGIELERLNKGEVRKKKKKKQEKKGQETEEDRWAEQMKVGGLVKRSASEAKREKEESDGDEVGDDDDDDDDNDDDEFKGTAVIPRLIKQNVFQGETGTVDVDKHMMAYIEEEMKKRNQRGEVDEKLNDAEKFKIALLNPNDELYSVDEKYKKILQSAKEALEAAKKNINSGSKAKEQDDREEGNATLSSAMLNGVPEVDLGIDQRMKNIEETERAKRAMMEAQKLKSRDIREEEEGDFASARFFKYGTRIQSDADIMRTAGSLGSNEEGMPLEGLSRRQPEHKRQTATDDAALERFKKRQRNQLKR